MTNNALGAAVLTAALAISSHALARAPAPLVPTALVEDVKSASADVDADPDCGGGCHACALKPLSGNDSNVSDASGQSAPQADFISDDAF